MDPLAALGSAIGSVKAGIELAKGALDAKVEAEVRRKVLDTTQALADALSQIVDAKVQMSQIFDENQELKRKLAEREEWTQRVAQYELVEAVGGALVYRFKGQPPHYVCPACYEERKLHILQDTKGFSGSCQCSGCGKHFRVNPARNPPTPTRPRGGGGWQRI
jgi:hypothetical protein